MKSSISPIKQLRVLWPKIVLILFVAAILIGIVLFIHWWKEVPIRSLTSDPTAVSKAPPYTGFLSQTGILLWSASAAISLFSATVLPRFTNNLKYRDFLVFSGLLSLALGLDDVFLLHEDVLPNIGIPQKLVILGYGGLMVVYFVKFYHIIFNTEYTLLGMALVFFGVSIFFDLFLHGAPNHDLFEEGAKLVGLLSWVLYFYRVASNLVADDPIKDTTLRD